MAKRPKDNDTPLLSWAGLDLKPPTLPAQLNFDSSLPPLLPARDYQRAIVDETFQLFFEHNFPAVLIVAATGLGKSVVSGHLGLRWQQTAQASGRSGRVLFIVHREEIIEQAARAFRQVCRSARVEIDQADRVATLDRDGRAGASIICASVQTLGGARLERYPPDYFGLVQIDEAHHAVRKNKSYRAILDRFAGAKKVGLTATPDRTDERALGQTFDCSLSQIYDLPWGIEQGWLVPVVGEMVNVDGIDVSGIEAKGDFKDGAGSGLDGVMRQEKPLHGIAKVAVDYATRTTAVKGGLRPTLIFAASVEHAAQLAEILNRRHFRDGTGTAAVVYSAAKGRATMKKDERRLILDRYRSREINYLCNYGVLTEGVDLPETRVVIIARPTKSRSLFAQMVGRGTRPWPEIVSDLNSCSCAEIRREVIAGSQKPGVCIVDPVAISGIHKLAGFTDVLGGWYDDDVISLAKSRIKEKGGVVNVNEELKAAKKLFEKLEAERRRHLIAEATYTVKPVNLFDRYDLSPGREPGWFKGKLATEKQKAVLKGAGVKASYVDGLSLFQASKLIEEVFRRRREGKCTINQAATLRKYGLDSEVSFQEATRLLNDLVAKGWPAPDRG